MYALTLTPPWGFAVRYLGKRIENRFWTPPESQLREGDWYAIHGGKLSGNPAGRAGQRLRAQAIELMRLAWPNQLGLAEHPFLDNLFDTGILALARHGGVVRQSDSMWFDDGDPGNYGWLLQDVIVFPQPIPCTGLQKLWRVPSLVAQQCEEFRSGRRGPRWTPDDPKLVRIAQALAAGCNNREHAGPDANRLYEKYQRFRAVPANSFEQCRDLAFCEFIAEVLNGDMS